MIAGDADVPVAESPFRRFVSDFSESRIAVGVVRGDLADERQGGGHRPEGSERRIGTEFGDEHRLEGFLGLVVVEVGVVEAERLSTGELPTAVQAPVARDPVQASVAIEVDGGDAVPASGPSAEARGEGPRRRAGVRSGGHGDRRIPG